MAYDSDYVTHLSGKIADRITRSRDVAADISHLDNWNGASSSDVGLHDSGRMDGWMSDIRLPGGIKHAIKQCLLEWQV